MSPMPDRCPLTMDELVILIGFFSLIAMMIWGVKILICKAITSFLDGEREFRDKMTEEAVRRGTK